MVGRNDPCPCGSGRKYKRCCLPKASPVRAPDAEVRRGDSLLRRKARDGFRGYPLATVAFYGPDDLRASKVAVGIVVSEGADVRYLQRWFCESGDARFDPVIEKAILEFLRECGTRTVAMTNALLGCPHEEGVDYAAGETCPRCPFWANRDRWAGVTAGRSGLGSAGADTERAARCGLCGKAERLMRTECCGNWICDDEDSYQLFSHARNSCARNHRRQTLCGAHDAEEHDGDWRDCAECRDAYETELYVHYGTNEYNFDVLENPPEFEPTLCAACGTAIALGKEGYSQKGDRYLCGKCTEREFPMPRGIAGR